MAGVVVAGHCQDIITSVAGGVTGFSGNGVTATNALLWNPYGVAAAVNPVSNGVMMFIADTENHRIRRVNSAGFIATIAGNGTQGFSGDGGTASTAMLSYPSGVQVVYNVSFNSEVTVFIADCNNHRIRRVSSTGVITTVAGTGEAGASGDGGPATAAQLYNPYSVSAVYNPQSGHVTLFIADASNHRIRRVDESGSISTFAGDG
ncbi:hypothetical protein EON62_03900, partial [archaeon]